MQKNIQFIQTVFIKSIFWSFLLLLKYNIYVRHVYSVKNCLNINSVSTVFNNSLFLSYLQAALIRLNIISQIPLECGIETIVCYNFVQAELFKKNPNSHIIYCIFVVCFKIVK